MWQKFKNTPIVSGISCLPIIGVFFMQKSEKQEIHGEYKKTDKENKPRHKEN